MADASDAGDARWGSARASQPARQADPRDENISRSMSVTFAPVLGSDREYKDLFSASGFTDYTDVVLHSTSGCVKFAAASRADRFVETFSGMKFKGQAMRCDKTRSSGVKTLYISWNESGRVSDRAIYDDLSPHGFIRRITNKGVFAFVVFDTADDATNALTFCHQRRREVFIGGYPVKVSYAKREQKVDLQKVTIPLQQLLPPDHHLWASIQKHLM